MTGPIIGVLLLGGIIALYFLSYVLNKNVKAPEGVEPLSKCSTCGNGSCTLKDKENYLGNENDECEVFVEALSNHD